MDNGGMPELPDGYFFRVTEKIRSYTYDGYALNFGVQLISTRARKWRKKPKEHVWAEQKCVRGSKVSVRQAAEYLADKLDVAIRLDANAARLVGDYPPKKLN